jgi:hypothetical protein
MGYNGGDTTSGSAYVYSPIAQVITVYFRGTGY